MTNKEFTEAQRLAAIGKANYNNGIAYGFELAAEIVENTGDLHVASLMRDKAATYRENAHKD